MSEVKLDCALFASSQTGLSRAKADPPPDGTWRERWRERHLEVWKQSSASSTVKTQFIDTLYSSLLPTTVVIPYIHNNQRLCSVSRTLSDQYSLVRYSYPSRSRAPSRAYEDHECAHQLEPCNNVKVEVTCAAGVQ
jgi:hypothetical protein